MEQVKTKVEPLMSSAPSGLQTSPPFGDAMEMLGCCSVTRYKTDHRINKTSQTISTVNTYSDYAILNDKFMINFTSKQNFKFRKRVIIFLPVTGSLKGELKFLLKMLFSN